MHRTQIYLDDDQDRELAAMAKRRHVTKSALIREAVDVFLGRRDDRLALEHLRQAVLEAAGIAPYLPSGADYIDEIRSHDAERWRSLEHGA